MPPPAGGFFIPKLNITRLIVNSRLLTFTALHLSTMKKLVRQTEMLLHAALTGILLLRGGQLILSHMYYPGVILLGLMSITMMITLFWKRLRLAPRDARMACYYLETPALLLNYVVFNTIGATLAAQVCLIATVALPFLGFATAIKTHRKRKVV